MGSSIDKMLIKGIRSFSPDNDAAITFQRPLTLIVGHNGAGKTTVIECLKMACTGDLPPHTRSGQSFVHDPKVAGESEVKAMIKLRFRTKDRAPAVVIRAFQLTVKKAGTQYKALDQVLQTLAGDGRTRQSLSHRCAELDRSVPELLGVSKAVLESVVFLHQEESNWPLSDGATLKRRFDEIFASAKYAKALEAIRKLRMEKTAEAREKTLRADHLATHARNAVALEEEARANARAAGERAAEAEGAERDAARAAAELSTAAAARARAERLAAVAEAAEARAAEAARSAARLLAKAAGEFGAEDAAVGRAELEGMARQLAPSLEAASKEQSALRAEAEGAEREASRARADADRVAREVGRLEAASEAAEGDVAEAAELVRRCIADGGLGGEGGGGGAAAGASQGSDVEEDDSTWASQEILEDLAAGGGGEGALRAVRRAVGVLRERAAAAEEAARAASSRRAETSSLHAARLRSASANVTRLHERRDAAGRALAEAERALEAARGELRAAPPHARVAAEEAERVVGEAAASARRADEALRAAAGGAREAEAAADELAALAARLAALRRERDELASAGEEATRARLARASARAKSEHARATLRAAEGEAGEALRDARVEGWEAALRDPERLEALFADAAARAKSAVADGTRDDADARARAREADASLAAARGALLRAEREHADAVEQVERALSEEAGGDAAGPGVAGAGGGAAEPGAAPGVDAAAAALARVRRLAEEAEAAKSSGQAKIQTSNAFGKMHRIFLQTAREECRCHTCGRGFLGEAEREAFVVRQEKEGAALPAVLERLGEELRRADRRAGALAALVPVAMRGTQLERGDLPRLRGEAAEAEAEAARAARDAAEAEGRLVRARDLQSRVDRLTRDAVWPAARLQREAAELHEQAGLAASSLAGPRAAPAREASEVDGDIADSERRRARLAEQREEASARLSRARAAAADAATRLAGAREERLAANREGERLEAIGREIGEGERRLAEARGCLANAEAAAAAAETALAETESSGAEGVRVAASEAETRGRARVSTASTLERLEAALARAEASDRAARGRERELAGLAEEAERLAAREREALRRAEAARGSAARRAEATLEHEALRRQVDDLLVVREAEEEAARARASATEARARAGEAGDPGGLRESEREAGRALGAARSAADRALGALAALREAERALQARARHPDLADAAARHVRARVDAAATGLAAGDLAAYHRALERALLSYHASRMAEINAILKELWQKTYRGSDIETVAIRTEGEGGPGAGGAAPARGHSYRTVMVVNGCELEMRGRCSAGQKVLACLLVRMALAEVFCGNCGVLALDEPTTNLDGENAASLARALNDIVEDRRKQGDDAFQLIVITHDEGFAEMLKVRDVADSLWRVEKDARGFSRVTRELVSR